MNADVAIVGAGVAGLSLAIKLAMRQPQKTVVVISKTTPFRSNSAYAQGGIAAVMDPRYDHPLLHAHDTLRAGGNYCNPLAVDLLANQAPARIRELIRWGANFDRQEEGTLHLGLEGGHSAHRIVHHKDQTGLEVVNILLHKARQFPNIRFLVPFMATRLLKNHHGHCVGVELAHAHSGHRLAVHAAATVLATGGCGQVFAATTNPSEATGDGIALALAAGVDVSGMQFIQFHPTALAVENAESLFLISEAVRGFGAHLVDDENRRFLFRYDARGELATRDVVSAAIFAELQSGRTRKVWLDLRHLPADELAAEFPYITQRLLAEGICPAKERIPVIPAAHYQCGGISTETDGKTSLSGLYALGECANNGLQGTNRLASNSLSEGLVFADFCADALADLPNYQAGGHRKGILHPKPLGVTPLPEAIELTTRIRQVMMRCAGQFARTEDLDFCGEALQQIETEGGQLPSRHIAALQVKNLLRVAQIIWSHTRSWQLHTGNMEPQKHLPHG
jgi:L-aspartate oxidase